jgi:hypothetical protein
MKYFIENFLSEERSVLAMFKLFFVFLVGFFILRAVINIKPENFENISNVTTEHITYNILPYKFNASYLDNLSLDSKPTESLKVLINKKKSGLVTDLNNLDHPKMVATIEMPKHMRVDNVIIYGTLNQGVNNNDNPNKIQIRVFEKKINNIEHNLIGTGIINQQIDLDVIDDGKNYLMIEVDCLDTIITGGSIKCSR